jgi:DNA-binding MarR family transcriptional regulator
MKDFADAAELDRIMASLEDRRWLTRSSDPSGPARLELTEAGLKGHAAALEIQTRVRQRTMQGITEDQYLAVIGTLKAMISSLEQEAPLKDPARHPPE